MYKLKFLRKTAAVTAFAVIGLCGSAAASATASLTTPAGPVRVQTYPGGTTIIWYTGAPCYNGQMVLDASDSLDRHKQLLATVLAAKAMNATLFLEYDTGGGYCVIRTFGVDGP